MRLVRPGEIFVRRAAASFAELTFPCPGLGKRGSFGVTLRLAADITASEPLSLARRFSVEFHALQSLFRETRRLSAASAPLRCNGRSFGLPGRSFSRHAMEMLSPHGGDSWAIEVDLSPLLGVL